MAEITFRASARKPSLRPDATGPAARLHCLAHRVERLATHGRLDPESICVAKLGIAHELRALAREIGR